MKSATNAAKSLGAEKCCSGLGVGFVVPHTDREWERQTREAIQGGGRKRWCGVRGGRSRLMPTEQWAPGHRVSFCCENLVVVFDLLCYYCTRPRL